MTDSNPHPLEPRQLTMVAALGSKLLPDPAAVAQLCGPLPADKIDRGAILLKRDRILGELASRRLEIDAEKGNREVAAVVRKARAAHAAGKLTDKEAWYWAHRKAGERLAQQRPENEKIARLIEAKTHELWAEARAGNWRVYGTDRETGRRVALSDELSGRPPSRMAVRENRIGLHEDVTFERVEEPAEEPAEEAPAAVAEQAAAVQDGQERLDEWYADCWVPACVEAGDIPSRDDDEEAAKRVFGARQISGTRDIVRDARKKHAPKAWSRSGPKGLYRKGARRDRAGYIERLNGAIERSIELWRERRGS